MGGVPPFSHFCLPAPLRSFAFAFWDSVEIFLDNMRWQHFPLAGLVSSTVATNLYVSSYIGTITSLQLSKSANGSYTLNTVAVNNGSEPNPTWLEKDKYSGVIYGLDEGLSVPNGSISSYTTSPSGELTQIDRHSTLNGPVAAIVYNGGKGIGVPH